MNTQSVSMADVSLPHLTVTFRKILKKGAGFLPLLQKVSIDAVVA